MSFRRRGTALDMIANSLGRWSSSLSLSLSLSRCAIIDGASFTDAFDLLRPLEEEGGGLDSFCWDLLKTFVLEEVEEWAWEEEEGVAAAFLSLRSLAAEARIADCTTGRMWSSTLLKVPKKKITFEEGPLPFPGGEGEGGKNDVYY